MKIGRLVNNIWLYQDDIKIAELTEMEDALDVAESFASYSGQSVVVIDKGRIKVVKV